MTEIEEPVGGEELTDDVGDLGNTEPLEPPETPEGEEPEQEPLEDEEPVELPDKFRGKSAAEIARMVEERDQTIGRQGEELRQYRQQSAPETATEVETAPTPDVQTTAYNETMQEYKEWETERKVDLRLQGHDELDIDERLVMVRQQKLDAIYSRTLRDVKARDNERRSRLRDQAPGIVRTMAESVLDELAPIKVKGMTAARIEQEIMADPDTVERFASSNPAQQRQMMRTMAIYLNGMRDLQDEVPITTEGTPQRATSVLRRNTAHARTTVAEDDPAFQSIYEQQKSFSGLDDSDPDQKTRITNMAKKVYSAQKSLNARGGGR